MRSVLIKLLLKEFCKKNIWKVLELSLENIVKNVIFTFCQFEAHSFLVTTYATQHFTNS